jgi:hypothetical protein
MSVVGKSVMSLQLYGSQGSTFIIEATNAPLNYSFGDPEWVEVTHRFDDGIGPTTQYLNPDNIIVTSTTLHYARMRLKVVRTQPGVNNILVWF